MNQLLSRLAGAFAITMLVVGIAAAQPKNTGINVPVTYYKLPNGLKVVLSPDHSAPLTTVATY